jgi:regulator of sigma E protease
LLYKIEGKEVKDIFDLQYFLVENKSPSVNVSIIRGGEEVKLDLKLREVEVQKAKGKDVFYAFPGKFMGERISPEPYVEKYDGFMSSLIYGTKRSLVMSMQIVGALVGLITGDVPLGALGGPMLIAKVAGESAALGLAAYLSTLAVISINLCMINLFPIPVLDGGQLVMLGAEAIKGRSLSEQAIENYQKVGFIMVMGLVLLSTYNDLGRFWASMLKTVGGQ